MILDFKGSAKAGTQKQNVETMCCNDEFCVLHRSLDVKQKFVVGFCFFVMTRFRQQAGKGQLPPMRPLAVPAYLECAWA